MNTKPPRYSIPIGPNRWIEFVDLTGRYAQALDIDSLIQDLEPLWCALETHCVAGCCGLDAFDFYPENIANAGSNIELESTCVELARLRSALKGSGAEVVVSRRLNSYVDIAVFDALIAHLESNLCRNQSGVA